MPDSRIRQLKTGTHAPGPVVYWMHREHRARDNWALLHAQNTASERKQPLCVIYALAPGFLEAGHRQFNFLVQGLEQTAATLEKLNIPFFMRMGEPVQVIPELITELRASTLVTDFDPLHIKRQWVDEICSTLDMEIFEVDGRNVVPCWVTSQKREYAARTIRPKIHRLLPEFLHPAPKLEKHQHTLKERPHCNTWKEAKEFAASLPGPSPTQFMPGEQGAADMLSTFMKTRLNQYGKGRNVPTNDTTSWLSPYLHFGQIASLRVALEVMESGKDRESIDSYLEQLIVRRELSDNFCLYEPNYDNTGCFDPWAANTLEKHAGDPRPALYTPEQFEQALTHDPLWNAAQKEMVNTGRMHGYMRMYWAKKILEWSRTPDEAMHTAILLNDRYQLDGRDPNGYTGVAWAIGGVHDRAWAERPVFGKIRFMSAGGAKSKFRVKDYIAAQEEKQGSLI